jgi:nucleoside-diphosphate-sugar epimerase
MKVLVTGSQGYIGSVLGGVLSKNGYDYLGYDTGFFSEGLLTAAPANEKIKKLDVRLIEERDIIGFDVVVHLAAISNDPMKKLSAEQVYDPTRLYTNKLAQMCKKHGVRFIFASSCSVYGIGSVNLLSEEASPNPQTPYSINKLQIEEDLMNLADK